MIGTASRLASAAPADGPERRIMATAAAAETDPSSASPSHTSTLRQPELPCASGVEIGIDGSGRSTTTERVLGRPSRAAGATSGSEGCCRGTTTGSGPVSAALGTARRMVDGAVVGRCCEATRPRRSAVDDALGRDALRSVFTGAVRMATVCRVTASARACVRTRRGTSVTPASEATGSGPAGSAAADAIGPDCAGSGRTSGSGSVAMPIEVGAAVSGAVAGAALVEGSGGATVCCLGAGLAGAPDPDGRFVLGSDRGGRNDKGSR